MLFRTLPLSLISTFLAFLKISIFSSQLGGLFIIYSPTLRLLVSRERGRLAASIQYLASFSILQLRHQTPAWSILAYIIRILHKYNHKKLQSYTTTGNQCCYYWDFEIVLILRISLATCNSPISVIMAMPTEAHALSV